MSWLPDNHSNIFFGQIDTIGQFPRVVMLLRVENVALSSTFMTQQVCRFEPLVKGADFE